MVFAVDKPDMGPVRISTRPRHRDYLRNPGGHQVKVLLGGPTMSEDGVAMNGTLLIVEAPVVEEVMAFVADDPYSKADLFSSVVVKPWAWSLGAPQEARA